MILLQIVTGALAVLVVYFLLSPANPAFRLGITVLAAGAYSLLSQLTLAERQDRYLITLIIIPLFLFMTGVGALGWYAQTTDPARDDSLRAENELMITSGMIKDALYTVSLRSMERYSSGADSLLIPEAQDTVNGYALIGKSIETPYNGTGIYLFLEYAGEESMVISGLSSRIGGKNPEFVNSGGYTGCLEFRARLTPAGISVERVN